MAILEHYSESPGFGPDRFHPVLLAQNERMKALLVYFEPGQFIPVHEPQIDVVLAILEGEGVIVCGEREEPVGPGAVAVMEAGESRGVKATTRMVALHVVTPPPTDCDHAKVHELLKAGAFR